MTDTPESRSERTASAGAHRPVNQILAWTGIVAAAVFVVAVVFFSGFFIGMNTDGFDGNRSCYHHVMPGPGTMGPGMMGPGMMGPHGPGGPGQTQVPTPTPSMPRP